MAQGDRGKWAEGRVRDYLKVLAETQGCAFMRLPDARAGSFQPTTADFLINYKALHTMLEIKEVDHTYRLPGKNFKQDQRARLANWRSVGTNTRVLVAHMPLKPSSGPQKLSMMWRAVPADWFGSEEIPSWNLSLHPLLTFDEAMEASLC